MSSDLIDIKKIDINNPAEVNGAVEFIIAYDLFVEAYLLIKRLEGKEGKEGKEEGAKLEIGNWKLEIISKLKWVALPKMKEEEIIKMFAENFTTIFEIEDYDLWGKLKQKIIYDIWYENRDPFKEKIKKALLKNEEKLTEKKIIINDKEYVPTVGNWLKDYNVRLGFESVDVAKQSEYLTNSGNMKKIKKGGREGKEVEEGEEINEKKKLKVLFKFYERLKISSLTPEGFEEGLYINEDGIEGVLDDGVFTEIDPDMEKRLKELQRIIDNVATATRGLSADSNADKTQMGGESGIMKQELRIKKGEEGERVSSIKYQASSGETGVADSAKKAYIFSLSEQEVIKQNEDDIKRVARGNIILVGKELTRALEQKNRPRVIAALRIAVKNNLLIGWAEKNTQINTDENTDKHRGKSVIRENPSAIRENPSKTMGKLNYCVIKFLRRILQERMGLSEHEAAKIGVHLFNLFRKQGRDVGYLAYYDEGNREFRWIEQGG